MKKYTFSLNKKKKKGEHLQPNKYIYESL